MGVEAKHGRCQQTFENKKCVDITQQCFALLPQVNFPANNLNFHWRWRWWDQIQAIFLNFFYFISKAFFSESFFRYVEGHWHFMRKCCLAQKQAQWTFLASLYVYIKVSQFQKQIFLFSFEPKTEWNYFFISALASKKRLDQKNKGALYH